MVNGMGQMNQMQMRKMDGSGNGQGNVMIKEVMQQLSQEDRSVIREQLQSMSPENRVDFQKQISEIDTSNMLPDDLFGAISDILGLNKTEDSITTDNSTLSFYA